MVRTLINFPLSLTANDEVCRYLKQEIYPPGTDHFTTVAWHPEQALQLVMATPCMYLRYSGEPLREDSLSSSSVDFPDIRMGYLRRCT